MSSGRRFLLTPLREGRRVALSANALREVFLLTPLREGRRPACRAMDSLNHFYSRPCGRGDDEGEPAAYIGSISTHAPAGGATLSALPSTAQTRVFLLTPLREGRLA